MVAPGVVQRYRAVTPERFARIRELFLAARQKAPSARDSYLRDACGGDEALRNEVGSLLSNDEEARSFLQTPALGSAIDVDHLGRLIDANGAACGRDRTQTTLQPVDPERIGQYRVLDVLGRGGMGVVYRAEQESPRRTVALKVIRPGVESREMFRRFETESQVLGWLQHPGIAQIYEAGAADTGHGPQPYFAMEFVHGLPLTQYAKRHRLRVREKLDLIAKICDAVHHAHQKGVVHRDLKPGNILVNEEGQPKILDFGVARATDSDIRTTTLQTDVGQLVGTIGYMSPEQVLGNSRELDTRSDVYSLGVIVYELLGGRLPHEVANLSIPHAVRLIGEEEPTRLSAVDRTLRGDVETIVGKALEKDKNRRYASAHDLALDIRRYLADEPIAARPASTVYQLKKFTKRNKALVAAIGIAFVALSVGLVKATIERNRAVEAERARARQAVLAQEEAARAQAAEAKADAEAEKAGTEADKAHAVSRFLQQMLHAANPQMAQGRDVSVRDVLDAAAERVATELHDQPEVEVHVRTVIGDTYRNLGLYKEAEAQIGAGVDLAREHLGPKNYDTLNLIHSHALICMELHDVDRAERLYRESLEGFREIVGEEDPATLGVMTNLVRPLAIRGKLDEAERMQRKTIEGYRRLHGNDHNRTLTSLHNLTSVLRMAGKVAETEPILREVLDGQRRTLGDDYPYTIFTMHSLASLLYDLDRSAEAESLGREGLERRKRVLGPEHPHTLDSMDFLANVLGDRGQFDEALALRQRLIELYTATAGPDHTKTIEAQLGLVRLQEARGELDNAETACRDLLGRARDAVGDSQEVTLDVRRTLCGILLKRQVLSAAEAECGEALQTGRDVLAADSSLLAALKVGYGSVLLNLGRYDEAEAPLREGYEQRRTRFGLKHRQTHESITLLAELYERWSRPEDAARFRELLSAPPPSP